MALYMFSGIMLLSSFIINSQILCLKKLTELSYLTEQVTALSPHGILCQFTIMMPNVLNCVLEIAQN